MSTTNSNQNNTTSLKDIVLKLQQDLLSINKKITKKAPPEYKNAYNNLTPPIDDCPEEMKAFAHYDPNYANEALQVAWNLSELGVEYCNSSYLGLARRLPSIVIKAKENYTFFEENGSVPIIVDEKTLAIGKALKTFYTAVSKSKDFQSTTFVLGKYLYQFTGLTQKDYQNGFTQMINILDVRIKIYEAQRPSSLEKIKLDWKKVKSYQEEYGLEKHNALFSPSKKLYETKLSVNTDETLLKNEIKRIKQICNLAEQKATHNDISQQYILTSYIMRILNEDAGNQLIWARSYHTTTRQDYKLYKPVEKIKDAYKLLVDVGHTYIDYFELKIKALKMLRDYNNDLNEHIKVLPELVGFEHLFIKDKENDLNKRIKVQEALVIELKEYRTYLEERINQLEQTYKKTPQIPSLNEALTYSDSFENLRNDFLEQQKQSLNTAEDEIKDLIEIIKREERSLKQLYKQSNKGRAELIKRSNNRIKKAFFENQKAEQHYKSFKNKTPRRPDAKALDDIQIKASNRREELNNSLNKINAYLKALKNNQSLYIPTTEIKEQALKSLLDEKDALLIDKLYQAESNARSQWGMNYYNLINYVDSVATKLFSYIMPLPIEDNEDEQSPLTKLGQNLEELVERLQNKKSEINQELQISLEDKPSSQITYPDTGSETLYALQSKYQMELNQPQKQHSENKKTAKFKAELADAEHRHAMLADDLLSLEFKLTDADTLQKKLADFTKNLGNLENIVALVEINQHKTLIDSVAFGLTPKATQYEIRNPSCKTLIEDSIKSAIRANNTQRWLQLNQSFESLTPEIKERYQKEIQTLTDEKAKLEESFDKQKEHYQNLNAKREQLLDQIDKIKHQHIQKIQETFNDILNKSRKLINANKVPEPNYNQGKAILPDILDALKTISLNKPYLSLKNPELQKTIEEISQAQHALEKLKEDCTTNIQQVDKAMESTKRLRRYQTQLKTMFSKYFYQDTGNAFFPTIVPGTFHKYLQERESTYWFKDLFSQFAALTLGCFGYKTEASIRRSYIQELEGQFKRYQNKPDEENYKALNDTIEQGLKKFSPRTEEGKKGYDKSLHAKLSALKNDLTPIQEQFSEKQASEKQSSPAP